MFCPRSYLFIPTGTRREVIGFKLKLTRPNGPDGWLAVHTLLSYEAAVFVFVINRESNELAKSSDREINRQYSDLGIEQLVS